MLLEACLQVHFILLLLRLLQTLIRSLLQMGIDICVHDVNVVNIVSPILSEVTDQEVTLLFRGLERRNIVWGGYTFGPGRILLRPLHGATCKY